MKVERIGPDEVLLTLSAGDAYRLSQTCDAAHEILMGGVADMQSLGFPEGTAPALAVHDARLFAAFGAALLACSFAAETQMDHPEEWEGVQRRLARYAGGGQVGR